jgi:hypothetical protein
MVEKWFIQGNYVENCNCRVSCPCTMDMRFKPSSSDGSCHVTLGFDIRNGRYGDVNLDGLGAVMVMNSAGALAEGNLRAALYLDARASSEQRDALQSIFSGQAGGLFGDLGPLIGEILGVKQAQITFDGDMQRCGVRVEGVTEATVEAIPGAIDQSRPITLDNMNIFNPGEPLTQAITVSSSYQDYGLEWDNTGQNGYITALKLDGP